MIEPPLLHQRHEERTGDTFYHRLRVEGRDGALVGARRNRTEGPDDAERAAFGGGDGGAGAWLDHADHRNGGNLPEMIERVCRAGVARDDDHLDATFEQELEDLARVAPDGVRGLRSVVDPRGVAEVDDGFPRQPLEKGARHRQSAKAGVEDAEGGVVHQRPIGMEMPAPRGKAWKWRSLGKSCRWADTKASAPANRWLKIQSTVQSCTSWRLACTLGEPVREK